MNASTGVAPSGAASEQEEEVGVANVAEAGDAAGRLVVFGQEEAQVPLSGYIFGFCHYSNPPTHTLLSCACHRSYSPTTGTDYSPWTADVTQMEASPFNSDNFGDGDSSDEELASPPSALCPTIYAKFEAAYLHARTLFERDQTIDRKENPWIVQLRVQHGGPGHNRWLPWHVLAHSDDMARIKPISMYVGGPSEGEHPWRIFFIKFRFSSLDDAKAIFETRQSSLTKGNRIYLKKMWTVVSPQGVLIPDPVSDQTPWQVQIKVPFFSKGASSDTPLLHNVIAARGILNSCVRVSDFALSLTSGGYHRDLHVIHQLPGGDVPQVQEVVGQNSRLPQCKDTRWCCPNCCVCSISIPSALVIPKRVGDSRHEGVGFARPGLDLREGRVHRERAVQA